MIVDNDLSKLEECENNEAMAIYWNIDTVGRSDFIPFYHKLLGKLRHGGKLHIKGTSLSLFCKHCLTFPEKRADLCSKIESSKTFHDLKELEIIMGDELNIESIWIEEEEFNIVGVRP
jgi:hypothetical protein